MMKLGERTRMPKARCLACGEISDSASEVGETVEDRSPTPGAVTVCFFCGHIQIFAEDLSLRELTEEEAHEVAGDPRILAIQKARQITRQKMQEEMSAKAWRIVGYHDATGYRTVLPIELPTREKAEKVLAVAKRLMPPSFRCVVEPVKDGKI